MNYLGLQISIVDMYLGFNSYVFSGKFGNVGICKNPFENF